MENPEEAAPTPRAPMWKRLGFSRWGPRAVFESMLIVLSVLLALWVNQWVEDRKTAERVAEARSFFHEELKANRAVVASERILAHHLALRKGLSEALAQEPASDEAVYEAIGRVFAGGIHPAGLRDAVWRSVSAGELMHAMEPREVFMLADIYRLQANLDEINRSSYASFMNADTDTPAARRKFARALALHLGDVVTTEQMLIGLYDDALVRLDSEPDGSAARR